MGWVKTHLSSLACCHKLFFSPPSSWKLAALDDPSKAWEPADMPSYISQPVGWCVADHRLKGMGRKEGLGMHWDHAHPFSFKDAHALGARWCPHPPDDHPTIPHSTPPHPKYRSVKMLSWDNSRLVCAAIPIINLSSMSLCAKQPCLHREKMVFLCPKLASHHHRCDCDYLRCESE